MKTDLERSPFSRQKLCLEHKQHSSNETHNSRLFSVEFDVSMLLS